MLDERDVNVTFPNWYVFFATFTVVSGYLAIKALESTRVLKQLIEMFG